MAEPLPPISATVPVLAPAAEYWRDADSARIEEAITRHYASFRQTPRQALIKLVGKTSGALNVTLDERLSYMVHHMAIASDRPPEALLELALNFEAQRKSPQITESRVGLAEQARLSATRLWTAYNTSYQTTYGLTENEWEELTRRINASSYAEGRYGDAGKRILAAFLAHPGDDERLGDAKRLDTFAQEQLDNLAARRIREADSSDLGYRNIALTGSDLTPALIRLTTAMNRNAVKARIFATTAAAAWFLEQDIGVDDLPTVGQSRSRMETSLKGLTKAYDVSTSLWIEPDDERNNEPYFRNVSQSPKGKTAPEPETPIEITQETEAQWQTIEGLPDFDTEEFLEAFAAYGWSREQAAVTYQPLRQFRLLTVRVEELRHRHENVVAAANNAIDAEQRLEAASLLQQVREIDAALTTAHEQLDASNETIAVDVIENQRAVSQFAGAGYEADIWAIAFAATTDLVVENDTQFRQEIENFVAAQPLDADVHEAVNTGVAAYFDDRSIIAEQTRETGQEPGRLVMLRSLQYEGSLDA